MRKQRVLAACLLSVVLSGVLVPASGARAQTPVPQVVAPQPVAAFDRKRFDALRTEGFEALYNLDYEGARRRFQEMAKAFPDHPAGPQFLAASLWLRTLNESRRLQASLYNTEGFYKEKDDKADPKAVAEFRELTRQAKALCEARLKLNPKDTEALYYLGAVEGLKAAFAGAVERSFMSALRNGSDAVERHRDVIKLDPNYHDAEVTIGMYDYVVGGLPLPVKLMAAIGGIRGSKKKGLATLERVAQEGQWARDDAKSMLIVLYKREKRYMDAYRNASELALKYGRNYIFRMESADALVSQAEVDRARDPEAAKKAEAQAFAIFESLLAPSRTVGREGAPAAGGPRRAARAARLVHYSYRDALRGRTRRARGEGIPRRRRAPERRAGARDARASARRAGARRGGQARRCGRAVQGRARARQRLRLARGGEARAQRALQDGEQQGRRRVCERRA